MDNHLCHMFQVIINYKNSTKHRLFQQDDMESKIVRGLVQGAERGKRQIVNAILSEKKCW